MTNNELCAWLAQQSPDVDVKIGFADEYGDEINTGTRLEITCLSRGDVIVIQGHVDSQSALARALT